MNVLNDIIFKSLSYKHKLHDKKTTEEFLLWLEALNDNYIFFALKQLSLQKMEYLDNLMPNRIKKIINNSTKPKIYDNLVEEYNTIIHNTSVKPLEVRKYKTIKEKIIALLKYK